MKKPKIEITEKTGALHCTQLRIGWMQEEEIADAYSDMIYALVDAKQYIENGIEYGYIKPPEKGDPAYNTLPRINKALKKAGCE